MTDRLHSSSSRSLLARLHREWRLVAHRPSTLRRAARWDLGVPFRSLDDIVESTGFWARQDARLSAHDSNGDSNGEIDGDAVMTRLLLAARVDDMAARVVLQRLLPGLVGRARHWAQRPAGGAEALDEILSAAWTVIRTYPVERRGSHLVANLLRDAEYHAFIRPHRRALVHEMTPTDLMDRAAVPEPVDPTVELAEIVAATRTLTDRDRRLVGLLVGGRPIGEVASALEVSVRTVTNHRDALVHRLRQTALEMASA